MADQEIKVASELPESTDQEHMAAIWPLTLEIKQSRASERNDQAHFLPIKHFDSSHKLYWWS